MKMKLAFVHISMLSLVLFLSGCGPKAGTEGDANDPAAASDTEQMEDETGDV